jgi:hypothetical protein
VTDQLLAWLALYGVPALFGILVITCAGVPFPDTLLLLTVGSFVDRREDHSNLKTDSGLGGRDPHRPAGAHEGYETIVE